MLVLTRKVGERINIGSDIVVTVTALVGGRVRVGIQAPRALDVWRSETRLPNGPAPLLIAAKTSRAELLCQP